MEKGGIGVVGLVCSLHVLPVAPLWQTLQDVITEAKLVISVAAVDTLQGNHHQLVWVPNNFLLTLEKEERTSVSGCERLTRWCCCINRDVLYHTEYFLPFQSLCVCV